MVQDPWGGGSRLGDRLISDNATFNNKHFTKDSIINIKLNFIGNTFHCWIAYITFGCFSSKHLRPLLQTDEWPLLATNGIVIYKNNLIMIYWRKTEVLYEGFLDSVWLSVKVKW